MHSATEQLFNGIDHGNLDEVKKALEDGAEVNAFNGRGYTPLMSTIVKAHSVNHDVNIAKNYEKIMRLLVHHKDIDIGAKSKVPLAEYEYNTAISIFSSNQHRYYGKFRYVEVLTAHPDVKARLDNSGEHARLLEKLFYQLFDIKQELSKAVFLNYHPSSISMLRKSRDQCVEQRDSHIRCEEEARLLSLFVSQGGIERIENGRALLSSICRGDRGESERLLNLPVNKVKIDCFDQDGNTVLHLIVNKQFIELLRPLIFNFKEDIIEIANDKNHKGKTWLDLANDNQEIKKEIEQIVRDSLFYAIYDNRNVQAIVEIFNADVNKLRNGISPLDCAKHLENHSICEYLEKKGAKSIGLDDNGRKVVDLEYSLHIKRKELKDKREKILVLNKDNQHKDTEIIELKKKFQRKNEKISQLTPQLNIAIEKIPKLKELYGSIQKCAFSIERQLKDKQQTIDNNITIARYCTHLSAAGVVVLTFTMLCLVYHDDFPILKIFRNEAVFTSLLLISLVCCLGSTVWFIYFKISKMNKMVDKDSINLPTIELLESNILPHTHNKSNESKDVNMLNDTNVTEILNNDDLVVAEAKKEDKGVTGTNDRDAYIVNLTNEIDASTRDIQDKKKQIEDLNQGVKDKEVRIAKLKRDNEDQEKEIRHLEKGIRDVNQMILQCREFRDNIQKNASSIARNFKYKLQEIDKCADNVRPCAYMGAAGSISALIIVPFLSLPITTFTPIMVIIFVTFASIYMCCAFTGVIAIIAPLLNGARLYVEEEPKFNIELPKSCIEFDNLLISQPCNFSEPNIT